MARRLGLVIGIDVDGAFRRLDAAGRVSFYIHWRKTSSSWLWQIPVTVRSSTRDIEQIAAATTQPFEGP